MIVLIEESDYTFRVCHFDKLLPNFGIVNLKYVCMSTKNNVDLTLWISLMVCSHSTQYWLNYACFPCSSCANGERYRLDQWGRTRTHLYCPRKAKQSKRQEGWSTSECLDIHCGSVDPHDWEGPNWDLGIDTRGVSSNGKVGRTSFTRRLVLAETLFQTQSLELRLNGRPSM